MKVIAFNDVTVGSTFSPASGEIGSQFVYIKRVNGICPKLGAKGEYGIFYPSDRVVTINFKPRNKN